SGVGPTGRTRSSATLSARRSRAENALAFEGDLWYLLGQHHGGDSMPKIQVFNANHQCLARAERPGEAELFYGAEYRPGDYLAATLDEGCVYGAVRLDAALDEAQVYMPGGRMT